MTKYVSCTKDVASSHISAGKRYEITRQDGDSFSFTADNGTNRFCLKEGCAHLAGVDGAEWVFHNEAEEVPAMKYKVGDRVRVIKCINNHGFDIGDVLTVVRDDESNLPYECALSGEEDTYWLSSEELEPAKDVIERLNFSVDIHTQAMKEFADHCERAAAALERIKDALK